MRAQISAKWRPGHRVYRNDDTGEFAEVNCPLLSLDECRVQRALLCKPRVNATKVFFDTPMPTGSIGQEATRDAA